MKNKIKNSHFVGYKIRQLRKNLGLTLEDLSVRCIQIDSSIAPSVSYLSLIETGNRKPSESLMSMLSDIFQKDIDWFLDETIKIEEESNSQSFSLEPKFLFSKELLSKSIPTLLSQTGTSGRQFARLLIRAYQEKNKNQFQNIEKIADSIGEKKFPLSLDDIFKICKKLDIKIKWFNKNPLKTVDDSSREITTLIRSFFQAPNIVYINKKLEKEPARLKYDLAIMIGHKILHNGDGILSINASGGELGGSPQPFEDKSEHIHQKDILYAWRDFESSYFAGALLCPKIPFRYFLLREAYNIDSYKKIDVTPGVYMRRITSVSNYKDWHYFDVYPPGYLRASYRGDEIPSPWGNMRLIPYGINNWPMFNLISSKKNTINQLYILIDKDKNNLYSSTSLKINDAAGNKHILSLGFDVGRVLKINNIDSHSVIDFLIKKINKSKKPYIIKGDMKNELLKVGHILNISWFIDCLDSPINIISPRNTNIKNSKKISWLNEVKNEIINKYA